MPKRSLGSLGAIVRKKRGEAIIRETALAIGIGPATLLRVESGRIPDVSTFGKICQWLEVDPGSFLGFKSTEKEEGKPLFVTAHLKADQTPKQETVNALAKMILFAAQSQPATKELSDNGDV